MEKIEREVVRDTLVNLTDQEKIEIGDKLAQTIAGIAEANQDIKAYVADRKGHIASLEAVKEGLCLELHRGKTWKKLPCIIVYDMRLGVLQVIRKDTGEEIECRPMTEEERVTAAQKDLALTVCVPCDVCGQESVYGSPGGKHHYCGAHSPKGEPKR